MSDYNLSKKSIDKYVKEYQNNVFNTGQQSVNISHETVYAFMSIFDKNKDGKISKKEMENVTEESFNELIEQMDKQGFFDKTSEITDSKIKKFSFNEFKSFLKYDGYISQQELETGVSEVLDTTPQKEQKSLKHFSQVTPEERTQAQKLSEERGFKTIVEMRKAINNSDENSDIVDFHIGTFNQGNSSVCTLLSSINGLSDDDLRNIYTKKYDKKGNEYYEVVFPNDKKQKKN